MEELPPDGQLRRVGGGETVASAKPITKTTDPEPDLICGVDRKLIESFLTLVKDNYSKADKATFFLEQRTGIVNVQGITNVRDVLSHLVTLLRPDTPDSKRLEQLANAEEHLRRSINEPYEIAVNEQMVRFSELYENYKTKVLPVQANHPTLSNAPKTTSIEARLKEIQNLTSTGRASKSKNLWNPEWEQGVTSFIEAFDKLFALYGELEEYLYKAERLELEDARAIEIKNLRAEIQKEGRDSRRLHLRGYVLAALLFVIATLQTLFPSMVDRTRSFLHLGQAAAVQQPQNPSQK